MSNPAEMTHPGRTWNDLTEKLRRVRPLALASDLPPDVAGALAENPAYPALFDAAFEGPEITPVRIAFAIAAYQRTLVADRTPWDRYMAGDETALSQQAVFGWQVFQRLRCVNCHEPPLFTNNDFLNIGLRLMRYDSGREGITGDPEDGGGNESAEPAQRRLAHTPHAHRRIRPLERGDHVLQHGPGATGPGRNPRGGYVRLRPYRL